MARKLSGVAHCVINTFTTAALAWPAAGAVAQSATQTSAPASAVVNPFAAKRKVAEQAGATMAEPAAKPQEPAPATAGPKTYSNPFAARGGAAPKFSLPRLHPGPLSRWHRQEQPSQPAVEEPKVSAAPIAAAPLAEQAVAVAGPKLVAEEPPVQAVVGEAQIQVADPWDLSGPLAVEEKRNALFAVPEVVHNPRSDSALPDPTRYSPGKIAQPAWLLPDVTQAAAASDESENVARATRAVAQSPSDPFEKNEVEEVIVSDDAPRAVAATTSQLLAPPHDPQTEAAAAPAMMVPELSEPPAPQAAAAPAHPPVVKVLPPPTPQSAAEWYAAAERSAAEATTTTELAAVVQQCQRGLDSQPSAELKPSLRGLAAWACNRSGEIESDSHREDEALKAFELAIQWDANCWLALHNRAVSRAQQGDLAGALADFDRALELNPGLAVAYRNRGELLAATGRTEAAIADYSTALAQLPQDAELHTMRGEAYHRMGNYDKSLADLSHAIELAPESPSAFAQRGNVYAELGDFKRAIGDFRKAISIDANSAEAHRSLAWLMATCPVESFRDSRQAMSSAERAVKLAPGDPFILDALAAALANAGQFDRAIHCQQEAIANVPADFAAPFQERLALYEHQQPFRNGTSELVDGNVRAASLEVSPATGNTPIAR